MLSLLEGYSLLHIVAGPRYQMMVWHNETFVFMPTIASVYPLLYVT